jgi:acyl-CoA thioesterase-1
VFFKFTHVYQFNVKLFVLLIPIILFSDQLAAKEQKLLILGDSLSAGYGISQAEGWVSLLQDMWKDSPIVVVNGSISGETSDGALARLPRLIEQHQPSHIYVELGGNDGLQGHPIDKMINNLSKIIEIGQASGATVILQSMQIPTNYGRRYTEMFSAAYQTLATEYEVALIPFFLQKIALNPDLMQRDGIHPNAQAQILIAKDMKNKLIDLILTSSTDNNQLDYNQ